MKTEMKDQLIAKWKGLCDEIAALTARIEAQIPPEFPSDRKEITSEKELKKALDNIKSQIEAKPDQEIKKGIPFKCPECGEIIQYGLSEELNKIIATSRLFNQSDTLSDISEALELASKKAGKIKSEANPGNAVTLPTKEFLKTELDKLDKNAFWEIDGTGNTEFVLKVIEKYHSQLTPAKDKVLLPPLTGDRGELIEILWKHATNMKGDETFIPVEEMDSIVDDILALGKDAQVTNEDIEAWFNNHANCYADTGDKQVITAMTFGAVCEMIAHFCKSQLAPAKEVTDEDIYNWADENVSDELMRKDIEYWHKAVDGAKAMRDGKIPVKSDEK